ncbi:MAG: hypothetical protein J0M25_00725 [Flavobacteriales bacterium]|nr:hypothetical protein [Flavobacteriales bacterium]
MNKDQLILKAKELGIENAETLTVEQLKAAIAEAEALAQAEAEKAALIEKATGLGIEVTSDMEVSDIEKLIIVTESGLVQAKLDAVTTALGLEDASGLTPDELAAKVAEKLQVNQSEEVKAEEPVGKTDKTFKASNGKTYGFAADAPAAFRYLGKKQTQEKWIADKDAMELMISGNLNFVEQIKK